MKLLEFDLSLEYIYFEHLEIIPDYQNKNKIGIETREDELIDKYNAELSGFNGVFHYQFKRHNYLSKNYKKIDQNELKKIEVQMERKKQAVKQKVLDAMNNNKFIMEWLYYQLSNENLKPNQKTIYPAYCLSILNKVLKRW